MKASALCGAASSVLLVLCLIPRRADAQLQTSKVYYATAMIADYERESKVWREHALVILPPTNLHLARPNPAEQGFFAWKLTFNGTDPITMVLRTDSAVAAVDERQVLRASTLYVCHDDKQPILDCRTPVHASAKRIGQAIHLDIIDRGIASRLRTSNPTILYRQLIEPGGRIRVDETGVIVP
jgi:hypothetical protein